jgi:hypothetical protein
LLLRCGVGGSADEENGGQAAGDRGGEHWRDHYSGGRLRGLRPEPEGRELLAPHSRA